MANTKSRNTANNHKIPSKLTTPTKQTNFELSVRPTAEAAFAELSDSDREWYQNGVRFECQGSGQCCVSHGEYGFVYMNLEDRRRMAKHLKMSTSAFTRKYCEQTEGFYHLKAIPEPECIFLKDKRCSVYAGRPTQCRTWPFWPEVMKPKVWAKEVAAFCPGVGKGRVWPVQEIETIMREQAKSES